MRSLVQIVHFHFLVFTDLTSPLPSARHETRLSTNLRPWHSNAVCSSTQVRLDVGLKLGSSGLKNTRHP